MDKIISHLAGASLVVLSITGAVQAEPSAPIQLASADSNDAGTIIVTGTRRSGVKVEDSPAPIQVLSSDTLARVGQPNLNQALAQIVPSFTTQAFGGDTSNLTLSARLRGLSPNHTLVLINGKRRHGTANLQVPSGPYQGGAAADLDLIPPEAIDHIEILQDGAAAQYGSDAIAGVINIILKSDRSGGSVSATAGSYYEDDGATRGESGRIALPIGEHGYFDLTALHRFHDFSVRGAGDRRVSQPNGSILTGVPASWASIPGFPNLNPILGDARSFLTTATYNAGYDFGDVEAYSFGSYSRRNARAHEQYRLPTRVSQTVNGTTTFPFPQGFVPELGLAEEDYSLTAGLRGDLSGWKWDLSVTQGQDKARISTLNSANASLYADTGFTPRDFYDGMFVSSQLVGNLDIKRDVEIGFASPLTVAFGGEFRRDTYKIQAGDAASIYKEGGQSYPGFQPTDAGSHSRRAWSGYVDLATKPVEGWLIDLAGRYEHYSDFGSKAIGKLTTRFDVSSWFAVRGTVSTGFRAPTLAEEYYSATNVSPTNATVQLPANSAAAKQVGFNSLKPEKSLNLSAGIVVRPVDQLTVTLDAYQINIHDRIAGTGTIVGKVGGVLVNQQVLDAIAAHGNVLDPTAQNVGVATFANGVNTRTRGIELALSYPSDFGFAKVDWSLGANYNQTTITKNKLGNALFNAIAQSNIETASPRFKGTLGALITGGIWGVNIRETLYGTTRQLTSPTGAAPFYEQKVGTALITDLEVTLRPVKRLELAIGANNLFDKKPPTAGFVPTSTTGPTAGPTIINGAQVYGAPYYFSPYGINGGYYYGRVTLNF